MTIRDVEDVSAALAADIRHGDPELVLKIAILDSLCTSFSVRLELKSTKVQQMIATVSSEQAVIALVKAVVTLAQGDFQMYWPQCPEHDRLMEIVDAGDFWYCTAGRHQIPIGHLGDWPLR